MSPKYEFFTNLQSTNPPVGRAGFVVRKFVFIVRTSVDNEMYKFIPFAV